MIYEKHIFICTNERKEGLRKSCGESHGLALIAAFKKAIVDLKLNINIRTQRTGCLDICEQGPMLVIYPDGVFYGNVQLSDVNEIIESHIVNQKIVNRLLITKKEKV